MAAPDEQLSLGLTTGQRVARLERLRLADAVVMAYELSILPEAVLPDPQKVEASLYTILQTLSLTLFEKTPMNQLLNDSALQNLNDENSIQLNLFD